MLQMPKFGYLSKFKITPLVYMKETHKKRRKEENKT
jgi:hypothetical protein